jgi:hypothetical protein
MITQVKYHIQSYNANGWIDKEITRDIDTAMRFYNQERNAHPTIAHRVQLVATMASVEPLPH